MKGIILTSVFCVIVCLLFDCFTLYVFQLPLIPTWMCKTNVPWTEDRQTVHDQPLWLFWDSVDACQYMCADVRSVVFLFFYRHRNVNLRNKDIPKDCYYKVTANYILSVGIILSDTRHAVNRLANQTESSPLGIIWLIWICMHAIEVY